MTALDNDAIEVTARRGEDPGVSVNGVLMPEQHAGVGGGGFEGAQRASRELASWQPRISSADQIISKDKGLLDGRAQDLLRNNGPTIGAANTMKDSIVGAQYRLNANPAYRYLGLDSVWAEEFQQEVEESFTLYAESDARWIDVERKLKLTDMVRLAVGCFFAGGEAVATMAWLKGRQRPFRTAMQMIDTSRVSNPNDREDTKLLRRGVQLDATGATVGLHIRRALQNDFSRSGDSFTWDYWPIWTPWGRLKTLHVIDPQRPEQSRGVADLVGALKETRMGKRFHEVALANSIVQASFAAAIESELPPEMAFQMIGANGMPADMSSASFSFLNAISEYSRGGKNIEIDGTKIPYLFPGTKLKLTPAGTAGGMGDKLEESLNRYIAATLGVSYEEYTHDYSKTNYSSLRAATNKTARSVKTRKRIIADATANAAYQCWLEEAITENHLETTKHLTAKDRFWFYERMNKEAVCRASWIGATAGQVDELKETQAAILRIASGLSTYEVESARLGYDFRDVYEQQLREKGMREKMGLTFDMSSSKPSSGSEEETDETTNNNGKSNDGFDD